MKKSAWIATSLGGTLTAAAILAGTFAVSPALAAGSNGGEHPDVGRYMSHLTQEQRDCIAATGISRPQGRPTSAQRQALIDAARTCAVNVPQNAGHGKPAANSDHRKGSNFFKNLTPQQRDALKAAGVTRPIGKPTAEQIQAIKDAALAAGITMPQALR